MSDVAPHLQKVCHDFFICHSRQNNDFIKFTLGLTPLSQGISGSCTKAHGQGGLAPLNAAYSSFLRIKERMEKRQGD